LAVVVVRLVGRGWLRVELMSREVVSARKRAVGSRRAKAAG
jgi:hypothetical protein